MSTNPLERIPKRSPKTSVTDLNEFAKTAGSTAASAAYPIMLGLTGEDTGDEWYEDLAYGAVPGGALVQRAKTGTVPGLLDLLPGDVGAGARLAMLPIAKFGAEEIAKGAARMGKSARNTEKALNPYVERWHRTRSKNDFSIGKKGLLAGGNNPNYGKNTGDHDALPLPAVWLGTSPTEIPVLQYYATHLPHEVSTYRVRIPKDKYYSTPRMKWDKGFRGNAGDARIVAKGESSLTGEVGRRTGNESLIDLYGSDISPKYLEKIPNDEIEKLSEHAKEMEWYKNEHGTGNETMSELGNSIVRDEMNNWMPASERFYLFDFSMPNTLDFEYRSPYEALVATNEHIMNAENGMPKYGYRVLSGEMPTKFDTKAEYYPKPEVKFKDPAAVSRGHVSRGWQSPVEEPDKKFDPKLRMFNWGMYNGLISEGHSPATATSFAAPVGKLVDTPNGLDIQYFRDPSSFYQKDNFEGAVSRGMRDGSSLAGELYRIATSEPTHTSAGYLETIDFANALRQADGNLASKAIENIATSDGKLGDLKSQLSETPFNFNKGKISKGYENTDRTDLNELYKTAIADYISDNDWMYDYDNPEDLARALESAKKDAKERVKEYMKDNIKDIYYKGIKRNRYYLGAKAPVDPSSKR